MPKMTKCQNHIFAEKENEKYTYYCTKNEYLNFNSLIYREN